MKLVPATVSCKMIRSRTSRQIRQDQARCAALLMQEVQEEVHRSDRDDLLPQTDAGA
jgi:hypothetical protein